MDENEDGKISNPFDKVPSWYDVEPLSTDELNPELVPPRRTRLGETAGTGYVPTRTKGSLAGRIWLGVLLFVTVSIGLFVVMIGVVSSGLFGPGDVVVGDCAGLFEADNVVGAAAGGIGCDDIAEFTGLSGAEVRVTEIVDVPVTQMPDRSDAFWNDMRDRCAATTEEFGVKFAWPLATTNAEWEMGNRSVACMNMWADEFSDGEQDVRQLAEISGMEVDEVMSLFVEESLGNWGLPRGTSMS